MIADPQGASFNATRFAPENRGQATHARSIPRL